MKLVNNTIFIGPIIFIDEPDILFISNYKLIRKIKFLNKTFCAYVYYKELNFDIVQSLIMRDQRLSISYTNDMFAGARIDTCAFKNSEYYKWEFEIKMRGSSDKITYSVDEFDACKDADNNLLDKFCKKYKIKNIEFLKKYINPKYNIKVNEIL